MMTAISNIEIYTPVYDKYYSDVDMTSTLFPITDQCERSASIMGEDYVRLVFSLKDRISFDAFSFIIYEGQTFFLREQYIPTPNGTMQEGSDVSSPYYSYDVKFVSVANMLDKHVCYRHVVVSGENGGEWYEPEININGNLETLYVIIMGAIKRAAEQWQDYYYGYLLNTIYVNGIGADGISPNLSKVKLTSGTKLLTFNFSGDNIANVCTTVANNFTNDDKKDTEWYITEQMGASDSSLTLHFAKCISENGEQMFTDYTYKDKGAYAFAHPNYTGGLKKVEYAQAWSGVTNTIVPYGSERNMTYEAVKGIDAITNMQSTFGKRLRLLPNTTYYVKDKEGNPTTIKTDGNGAIRNEMVNTGIEEVKFYDEVYPQGHFKVIEVKQRNKRQDGQTVPEYTILATPVDNAGNDIPEESVPSGFYPIQIEEGTTLSVRFESGLLNGREFEIANKTKSELKVIMGEEVRVYSLAFTIVADGSLEDGTLIPSGNFIPRAADSSYEGDRFALFNMKMPQVYIDQARNELAQEAYTTLLDIQTTRPEVKCSTDPVNFNGFIGLGDVMRISSELFNSEDYEFVSRVIRYSYKLSTPREAEFSLASAVMQGTLSSMNDLIADVTNAAGGLEQRAINLSRRAWRDASEVAEMLDSITAEMMLVGNERYQFAFTSSIECVDVSDKFSSLKIGNGTIQHTQQPYIDYANAGFWYVSEQSLTTDEVGGALDKDKAYYLYAKVANDSAPATMVLSDSYYDTNDSYLLFGILSSEFEDKRVFSRTNGFTAIEGGTITTEQIQDAGRNLIIDFQSNPPRIIARNGAVIEGNMRFTSAKDSNGNDILAELAGLKNIGGKNLLSSTAFHKEYRVAQQVQFTKLYSLEAGKKYVASYGKFENNAGGVVNEPFNGVCLAIGTANALENIERVCRFGESFEVNGNGRELYIAWAVYEYVNYEKGNTPTAEVTTDFTQYLDEVMLQEGEVATAFQPSIDEELEEIEQLQEDFQESLDKINSDEWFSIAEKKLIRTNWEAISGLADTSDTPAYYEKNGSYGEASNAVVTDIDTTNLDTAFETLRTFLNLNGLYLEEDTNWTTTGRSTMSSYFTAYYNAETALWKAINEAYAESVVGDMSSYEYLKEAMQAETDIYGGLLSTSLIRMRYWAGDYIDDNGKIYKDEGVGRTKRYIETAGLSGLKDDNILLYGGGSYQDALDFLDGDLGNGINILLRKDGKGRIGVFDIRDNEVVVNVPGVGKVVINALDGVMVKDSNEMTKALLTPKNMNDSENDIKVETFKNVDIKVSKSEILDTNGLSFTKVLWSRENAPEKSIVNGTLDVTAKFKIDLSRQSEEDHWIRMIVYLGETYGFQNMTGDLDVTSDTFQKGYFGSDEDREITLRSSCTFTNAEVKNLDEIKVYAILVAEDRYHEIIDPTFSFEDNVEISAQINLTTERKEENTQYTIVAKDGFLSKSGSNMFKVLNEEGGKQKIFAKGLSNTKGSSGSGELYVSRDFIDSFRSLCTTLKTAFEDVRFVGANKDHADDIADALEDVNAKLNVTSIIANS